MRAGVHDEFGDFQTPLALARRCLAVLGLPRRARVLEPTCGRGAFLRAAAECAPDSERVGVEIQPEHAAAASAWATVHTADVFRMDVARDIRWQQTDAPLFVVGNPPWVTAAALNRMGSANLPVKQNFKGARGIDALLGSSNFDVCEYVMIKVLRELAETAGTLGMLCKTHVARTVLGYAHDAGLPVARATVHRIDAARWFGAGVDACWFTAEVDPLRDKDFTAAMFTGLDDTNPDPPRFGMVDGRMVADVGRYAAVRAADGASGYEWRSGLKHDAAAVFELTAAAGAPMTRAGEPVDVEPDYVFPLLKGTDLFRGRTSARSVIVPQRTFGEDTATLASRAPKLWAYLNDNAAALDGRRSSIYRNRPRFSVFGHGPYTWAPFKVAISGLHKQPAFRLVPPLDGKPVVLDDTCYFLPFHDPTEAAVVLALLDSPACTDLIESLVFWDAKRPIAKKLLARIDLAALPVDPTAIGAAATEHAARIGHRLDRDTADALLTARR